MEQSGNLRRSGKVESARHISRLGALAAYSALGSGILLASAALWRILRRPKQHNDEMDVMASLSHELRTPLAAILSAGENIRDGLATDREGFQQQGAIITAQARRLSILIDQMLLHAAGHRPPPPGNVAVHAADLVEEALAGVSILLEQNGFVVQRSVEPGLPPSSGDLFVLSQCLQNFLVNAMKYSGDSRWIEISAYRGLASGNPRGEIQISVRDGGIGIDPADLPHIFEPHYRSRQDEVANIRGNGMGLFIAKKGAEACGGRVSVASEKNIGSLFTLHLPVPEDSASTDAFERLEE